MFPCHQFHEYHLFWQYHPFHFVNSIPVATSYPPIPLILLFQSTDSISSISLFNSINYNKSINTTYAVHFINSLRSIDLISSMNSVNAIDLGVGDTKSDSIQCLNLAKKWFIQYSIQYCFTQHSIQNIIQLKKICWFNSKDNSIQ